MPSTIETPMSILVDRVIDKQFNKNVTLPFQGELFLDYESVLRRVQQYAFAQGFAVIETLYDEEQQHKVWSCVHHLKPCNLGDPAPYAVRCPFEVSVTKRVHYSGYVWKFNGGNIHHTHPLIPEDPFVYEENLNLYLFGSEKLIMNASPVCDLRATGQMAEK